MGIRAYIQPTAVTSISGQNGKYAEGHSVYQAGSTTPFIMLDGGLPEVSSVDPVLAAICTNFSYHGEFMGGKTGANRKYGVYRHKTAVAVVDYETNPSKSGMQTIRIEAESLLDMAELYHQVRAGLILPRPGDSFEDGQAQRLAMFPTVEYLKVQILQTVQDILVLFKQFISRYA